VAADGFSVSQDAMFSCEMPESGGQKSEVEQLRRRRMERFKELRDATVHDRRREAHRRRSEQLREGAEVRGDD
jgi:hypothetical protein